MTYLGNHTAAVQRGLNLGVALFIVSEALFFLAIFWAFFHSALSPTVELGAQWPPLGIQAINPFELPLLNTVNRVIISDIYNVAVLVGIQLYEHKTLYYLSFRSRLHFTFPSYGSPVLPRGILSFPFFLLFFHLRLTLRRSLFSTSSFGESAKLSFDREAQVIFMSFLSESLAKLTRSC